MRNRWIAGALLGAVMITTGPFSLLAQGGSPTMVLEMTRSYIPGGGEGKLGTMTVSRASETVPMKITWNYPDGGVMTGWGVPMPGTGQMALSFGNGALAVALYKRDGKSVQALWSPAADGSTVAPYKMTQGATDSEYIIDGGGGTFTIDMGEEGTGTARWKLPSGEYNGLVIAEGDYLAAVSMAPGADAGVGLYTLDMAQLRAVGRWAIPGVKGAGGEEYKVVSINGEKVPATATAAAAPTSTAGMASVSASPEAVIAVKAIAEELRVDLAAAQKYKPTKKQIAAITATDADAEALSAYLDKLYAELPAGKSAAKDGQTVINVEGPAWEELPGGYTKAKAHFDPSVQFYGFEYVEPGEEHGMSYDGLAQVGGSWALFPKAWRAFEK